MVTWFISRAKLRCTLLKESSLLRWYTAMGMGTMFCPEIANDYAKNLTEPGCTHKWQLEAFL